MWFYFYTFPKVVPGVFLYVKDDGFEQSFLETRPSLVFNGFINLDCCLS